LDKPIKKKTWTAGRIVFLVISVLVIASLAYLYASRSGKPRLKVDPGRMTFSKVGYGEFREYYPFDATVEPVTSVYLDVETGGRVDQIFVEGGKFVTKGDLILRFSNASLQRNSIETESRLLENLDIQRNTMFTREQNILIQKENVLNLDYQISDLERKYKRYHDLGDYSNVIPEEEFQRVRDELAYKKRQKELLEERIRQEERLTQIQLEQASKSIERLNKSMDLLAKTVESLDESTHLRLPVQHRCRSRAECWTGQADWPD
jgi:HlyD family secretion protein